MLSIQTVGIMNPRVFAFASGCSLPLSWKVKKPNTNY